ncbi:MAG: hypothetical protein ACAI35_08345 [Candidatus Methylacidiphilales bacterium]|nr:hypothetical protein [Candidatus Methylacidiphilales bacterium]
MKIHVREASDIGDDIGAIENAIITVHKAMEDTPYNVVRVDIYLGRKLCVPGNNKPMMCMLDARIKGGIPIAVMEDGPTIEEAVQKAVLDLKKTLHRLFGNRVPDN